ncbi:MAG TPA: hypothetical protein VI818_00255, partial [Candidatus Thermoplasmatota archaeon]|nr:hypothetical protein [Candidatus Thermoplasmatota archaeon]
MEQVETRQKRKVVGMACAAFALAVGLPVAAPTAAALVGEQCRLRGYDTDYLSWGDTEDHDGALVLETTHTSTTVSGHGKKQTTTTTTRTVCHELAG